MKASAAELGGERGPCCSSDPARSSSNPRLAEPPHAVAPVSLYPRDPHLSTSWSPGLHVCIDLVLARRLQALGPSLAKLPGLS